MKQTALNWAETRRYDKMQNNMKHRLVSIKGRRMFALIQTRKNRQLSESKSRCRFSASIHLFYWISSCGDVYSSALTVDYHYQQSPCCNWELWHFFIFWLSSTFSNNVRLSALFVWVLWHIYLCRLFNAKSIFIQILSSISSYSV